MVSFAADPDGIGALGTQLLGLRAEILGMKGLIETHYASAAGNEEVADRLGDFAGNWSRTMEQVEGALTSAAGALGKTAAAYAAAEHKNRSRTRRVAPP